MELQRRGYDQALSLGSLAGAGSLGLLIPPSIVMIIYGVLAEVSIARLFAAGVVPGLMIAVLYSGYVAARCMANRSLAPKEDRDGDAPSTLQALILLAPVFALIAVVLGAIYTGVATPSEAAAIGVAATLGLVAATGQLKVETLVQSLLGAVRMSCMICAILVAAAFLSTAMGYMHVPQDVARAHRRAGTLDLTVLSRCWPSSISCLGLFLDGVSITVMSLPITLPLALSMGFDPIWFGVFLILMVEIGQMTPPVGFNLFVLQGMTGVPINRIALAAAPFFMLMLGAVAAIVVWPEIVLWLPDLMFNKA